MGIKHDLCNDNKTSLFIHTILARQVGVDAVADGGVNMLSPKDMEIGIIRLKKCLDEVGAQEREALNSEDPRIEALRTRISNAVVDIFGSNTPESRQHRSFTLLRTGQMTMTDTPQRKQQLYVAGIQDTKVRLKSLIGQLEEKLELQSMKTASVAVDKAAAAPAPSRNIFIIHGHDDEVKEKVARFLSQLKLIPIILHEQPNNGKTIIEKFETHAKDAGFAVALLTPDDVGHVKNHPDKASPRARQNVIYEMGFFHGNLGRGAVCAIYKGGVELPSDYAGVLYIEFKGDDWKVPLAKEIRASGIDVDLNLL